MNRVPRVGVGGRALRPPQLRSWMSCVPACEVHFENTRVPVENVLGEVGGGFKVRCPACADLCCSLVCVGPASRHLPAGSALGWAGRAAMHGSLHGGQQSGEKSALGGRGAAALSLTLPHVGVESSPSQWREQPSGPAKLRTHSPGSSVLTLIFFS